MRYSIFHQGKRIGTVGGPYGVRHFEVAEAPPILVTPSAGPAPNVQLRTYRVSVQYRGLTDEFAVASQHGLEFWKNIDGFKEAT